MEKITITGGVVKEAAVKDINGKSYTCFSVGVNTGKNKDGSYKPSNYYNCTAYGDKTNIIKPGCKVLVTGNPSFKIWNEKVQRDIWVDNFEILVYSDKEDKSPPVSEETVSGLPF